MELAVCSPHTRFMHFRSMLSLHSIEWTCGARCISCDYVFRGHSKLRDHMNKDHLKFLKDD